MQLAAATPDTAPSLTQVLADCRGDAAVLRRAGHPGDADLLERFADQVARAAAPFLNFMSETEAMLRSGRSRDWLRAQFAAWERERFARWQGKERQYLEAVVPRRPALSQAREAGKAAARAQRGRR